MAETLTRFPEFALIHNGDFEHLQRRRQFLQPMEGFDELLETARTREVSMEGMCSAPLLTKDQEQYLFRQYNCLKYAANLLRGKNRKRDREKLARFHKQVKEIQDVLCMCNMRLGVSQLKKRNLTPEQFENLLSHVQESILRAIARFDYARGNKFSTYCSWAIIKNLYRLVPAERSNDSRLHYCDELPYEPRYEPDLDAEIAVNEHVNLVEDLLSCLDKRQQAIIRSYSLGKEKETLEVIGGRLGITKERVRQIKMRAMRMLREVAHDRYPGMVGAM
jgi:RNA polymerase sigma factor (sigma-70 family)